MLEKKAHSLDFNPDVELFLLGTHPPTTTSISGCVRHTDIWLTGHTLSIGSSVTEGGPGAIGVAFPTYHPTRLLLFLQQCVASLKPSELTETLLVELQVGERLMC